MDFRSGMILPTCNQLGKHECRNEMHKHATKLGTFKQRLDEHHLALLRCFAVWHCYTTGLTYLRTFLLSPCGCYADLLW